MDSQKEVEDDAAELKATLDRIKQDQALHKAQQVELKGVEVPEGLKSNGPVISLSRMPRFYDRGTNPPPGERQQRKKDGEPKEPKVFVSSKGKLDQFRKEAKAMAHFQKPAGRPGIFAPSKSGLRPVTTNRTITAAPRILVEEHRKAASPAVLDPSLKPPVVFAPKRKRVEHDKASRPNILTNEEREKRLKAFTNPSSDSKSTPDKATSTPPVPNSSISPPLRNVATPSPVAPKLATSPVLKMEATPSFYSPLKREDRASPAPGHGVQRANTSSPSNGATRTMPMKKKAPVDVFMPAKRRKIS